MVLIRGKEVTVVRETTQERMQRTFEQFGLEGLANVGRFRPSLFGIEGRDVSPGFVTPLRITSVEQPSDIPDTLEKLDIVDSRAGQEDITTPVEPPGPMQGTITGLGFGDQPIDILGPSAGVTFPNVSQETIRNLTAEAKLAEKQRGAITAFKTPEQREQEALLERQEARFSVAGFAGFDEAILTPAAFETKFGPLGGFVKFGSESLKATLFPEKTLAQIPGKGFQVEKIPELLRKADPTTIAAQAAGLTAFAAEPFIGGALLGKAAARGGAALRRAGVLVTDPLIESRLGFDLSRFRQVGKGTTEGVTDFGFILRSGKEEAPDLTKLFLQKTGPEDTTKFTDIFGRSVFREKKVGEKSILDIATIFKDDKDIFVAPGRFVLKKEGEKTVIEKFAANVFKVDIPDVQRLRKGKAPSGIFEELPGKKPKITLLSEERGAGVILEKKGVGETFLGSLEKAGKEKAVIRGVDKDIISFQRQLDDRIKEFLTAFRADADVISLTKAREEAFFVTKAAKKRPPLGGIKPFGVKTTVEEGVQAALKQQTKQIAKVVRARKVAEPKQLISPPAAGFVGVQQLDPFADILFTKKPKTTGPPSMLVTAETQALSPFRAGLAEIPGQRELPFLGGRDILGPSKDAPKIKPKVGTSIFDLAATEQAAAQRDLLGIGEKALTGQALIPTTEQIIMPDIGSAILTGQIVGQSQAQAQAQAQAQEQAQAVAQLTEQATGIRPKPRVRPRPRPRPLLLPILPILPGAPKARKKKGAAPGYDAFVKVRGRVKKLTKNPRTRTTALSIGALFTDNTPTASFTIRKSGKAAQGVENLAWNALKGKFRKRRTKNALEVVEKSKHRIDTIGELMGIPGEAKRRRRKV